MHIKTLYKEPSMIHLKKKKVIYDNREVVNFGSIG